VPSFPLSTARLWFWLILFLMGVAWGLSFSLAKIAAEGGGHPLGITLWQAMLGALFLSAVTLGQGRVVSFKGNLPQLYVICALLGTVVPGVIFYAAARHVPAGVLSISVTLVPILTVFLAVILRVERLALSRVAGVLCGMAAVILLVGPEESLPSAAAVPWVLLACLASACYAVENLVIALRMPESANPFMVACGMHLVATVVLLPLVLATDSFVTLAWPWDRVAWSIVGLSALNAFAYSLFIYLVHQAGPVFASQVAYVVTLSGVIWGMAIFGEAHSAWVWLSLVVMLAGLAMVTPRRK
jgi:drug/metabolite transporter (DMT)-like permease